MRVLLSLVQPMDRFNKHVAHPTNGLKLRSLLLLACETLFVVDMKLQSAGWLEFPNIHECQIPLTFYIMILWGCHVTNMHSTNCG